MEHQPHQAHSKNVSEHRYLRVNLQKSRLPTLLLLLLTLILASCQDQENLPQLPQPTSYQISLTVDDELFNLTTNATTVNQLLDEAGVTLDPLDEVNPPPFTQLTDNLQVTVTRRTETLEIIEENIPFNRQIVRNENMAANDPPRIVQGGQTGLQEITVRIVYENGLEVDRQRTQITLIQEPQDEIIMIGVGALLDNASFSGQLAYISGGIAVIMRGNTLFPEQLETGTGLDGRVFALSPTGSHLLYTRIVSDTGRFNNSLWVISTTRGAQPRPLGINNILWAGWNPARTELRQIAYTTANPVDTPPGWEANNDLWTGNVLENEEADFTPEIIVEAYPATFGWWGGTYAWAPNGQHLAYGYADEVGIINVTADIDIEEGSQAPRTQLKTFTEFNTRSDWVWIPTLSWSPDSTYLTFSQHSSDDPDNALFDTWVVNSTGLISNQFVNQSGMWTHPHWSPFTDIRAGDIVSGTVTPAGNSHIAFLRATNPLDSLNSTYTLWLMDQDGSNTHQIYPPIGENSRFPFEEQFMSWAPTGRDIAFIFDNALHLLSLDSGEAFRITQDDTLASRPTWAPYGRGITNAIQATQLIPFDPTSGTFEDFLPDDQ